MSLRVFQPLYGSEIAQPCLYEDDTGLLLNSNPQWNIIDFLELPRPSAAGVNYEGERVDIVDGTSHSLAEYIS